MKISYDLDMDSLHDVFITERQRQKKLYISKLTTDDDVIVSYEDFTESEEI